MELSGTMVWIVLVVVVLLFTIDRYSPDAIALGGLLILVGVGSLSPGEALAGFSSPAVIAIASLLVLSAALERSGVVRRIAEGLYRFSGKSERRLLVAGTLVPGFLSGIINIIATVSVFIPVLLRLALKTRRSPARLLLPMAYVSMAGANLTLIGASANLVANDILRERTGSDFSLLEFAPIGAIMIALTTLYVLVTAHWLLPERKPDTESGTEDQTRALIRDYEFYERVWELEVQEGTRAVGMEVSDLELSERYGLSLISLVRADHSRPHIRKTSSLEAGDILLVGGRRERVEALGKAVDGLDMHGAPAYRDDFSAGSSELIEVMVPPRSSVIGKSVRNLDLRGKADLTAIALWRDGHPLRTDADTTPLASGDAILLYGDKRYTRGFEPEPELLWLHPPQKESAPDRAVRLAPWTVLIFLLVIVIAALDWYPIEITALAGALAVTLIGSLSARQAYTRIDWHTIVLIAAMLPFATALQNHGASEQLAYWLANSLGGWGPLAVMGIIASISLLLTQALHNAAVAAVMTPVAIDAALQLGGNPKAFTVTVIVASSMSVLLPIGHPAPLLVRRNGGYDNSDYLRFGSGLAILTLATILVAIPLLWPVSEG